MAKVVYIDGIELLRGALDSVKEGQANRMRLISRFIYRGEKSFTEDGRRYHDMYYMHMFEGEWPEGCVKNREMIKAAQRLAHAIEREPELREPWVACYAAYRAGFPAGEKKVKHFYGYVFSVIYAEMREKLGEGGESKMEN